MNIRFIRIYSNGSNVNSYNHFVEVQAINKNNENVAYGKGLFYYSSKKDGNASYVTDGITNNSNNYFGTNGGLQNIIIDLGSVVDVESIKMWRYYADGRVYNGTIIQVSTDNETYTDVFNYETDGTYAETSEGKTIYLPSDSSKKYLIKSENVIYTITGGALQALTETEITSSLFQTYGVDSVPDGSLLLNLSNPSVMYWTNSEELPVITANVTATPQSQNVISNAIDLTHKSITGIENMVATCEGDLIIAVSFDGKQTWKAWNGSEWSTLSEEFTGMNKETLEAITFEQWNLLFQGATSFYIRISLVDTTQSVTEIYVDFAN